MKRLLEQWRRTSKTITPTAEAALLDTLQRNPELSRADARNELRWLREDRPPGGVLARRVERRARGEPLQYILGTVDFGPLRLMTRKPTLIPRPETAHVFERFALSLPSTAPLRVLDLCTGSAPIPLLLSHILGNRLALAHGVDAQRSALRLAAANIQSLGDTRVTVEWADVFRPSMGAGDAAQPWPHVDVITANPPYIAEDVWHSLPDSVKMWEDRAALVAAQRGLAFYHRIAEMVQPMGARHVAVEIGHGQGKDVEQIFQAKGVRTELWRDQADRERMVVGHVER